MGNCYYKRSARADYIKAFITESVVNQEIACYLSQTKIIRILGLYTFSCVKWNFNTSKRRFKFK